MNNNPKIHCPGFERFKDLKSFLCKCQSCGAEIEIFSDEFERERNCKTCHQKIDFTKCEYYGGGEDPSSR